MHKLSKKTILPLRQKPNQSKAHEYYIRAKHIDLYHFPSIFFSYLAYFKPLWQKQLFVLISKWEKIIHWQQKPPVRYQNYTFIMNKC